MLSVIVKTYWQVGIFKQSPENTPHSNAWLLFFAALFYLIVISQWSMVEAKHPLTLSQIMLAGLLLCVSYTLYTYILLRVHQLEARFIQTLTSLFAVHAIIHLFAYPLLPVLPILSDESKPPFLLLLIVFLYLVLTFLLTAWQIMVTYFIYKKALNVDNLAAIFATIGLFVANILLVSVIR